MGYKTKTYLAQKRDEHHGAEHHNAEHHNAEHHNAEHHDTYDFLYEAFARKLMDLPGFIDFVKKHGYHFTNELAEHVSRMMENANGAEHTWTAAQVEKAMTGLGLTIPAHVTLGDVTYLANMYYADLYPEPLKDEASCLKAAHKIAHDPDGYEGMIFCRWTADVIGKAVDIDWPKFV